MRTTVHPHRGALSGTDAYFRDINRTPILTPTEERALSQRIVDGDAEARDHLVRANLRLVVRIARSYHREGVDLQDMIAEGNLGLIRAAEAFDPAQETRFSTYAKFWIKQSIKRMIINTSKPIRLPAYMNELMVKWHRAQKQLTDQFDRVPTFEEIAHVLGLAPKKLAMIRKAIRIYNGSTSTGQTDESQSVDTTVADDARAPEETLAQQEDVSKVLHLLNYLDEREAAVLRLRFGLGTDEPCTLVKIGERLGLTRERVRQIEKEALNNLAAMIEL